MKRIVIKQPLVHKGDTSILLLLPVSGSDIRDEQLKYVIRQLRPVKEVGRKQLCTEKTHDIYEVEYVSTEDENFRKIKNDNGFIELEIQLPSPIS